MPVIGGNSGWQRATTRLGTGSLVALGLAVACGGRTSALDSSVYDGSTDGLSGGGGNAGAATSGKAGASPTRGGAGGGPPSGAGGKPAASGGRASTGGGGGGGTGAGPATGGAGAGGSLAIEIASACKEHCSSYGFICETDVGACMRTCEQELSSVRDDCKPLGLTALRCVARLFQTTGVTCVSGTEVALARCGRPLDVFETCKGAPFSTPVPRDNDPDVSSCAGTLSEYASGCEALFSCDQGDYRVYCDHGVPSPGTFANCSCVGPDGTVGSGPVENQGKACYLAAQLLCLN